MREYVQELPHSTPSRAWQRSVTLSKELIIDPAAEPRVRMTTGAKEVTAGHPFFWAGYLLVDRQPARGAEPAAKPDEEKPEGDKVDAESAGDSKAEP
jgi:hypothetical protein